jgi:hypothetical protein
VADLVPTSPEWWVKRLYNELNARQGDMQLYRDLVDDNHAPAKTSEQSEKFARMAGLATTNLTGLVVEATAERIEVEGFRFGDNPDGDKDAWRIWQESDFDAGSADAITHALVYGRCPISVDPAGPRLVVEDPRQVVVAYSSDGRRDRLAALKVFTDEWTGAWYATLYLPDAIYRYEDVRQPRYSSTEPLWTPREVGGTPAVSANPFGEVPFFELRNRPLGRTRSEIANIVVPQLRLNQAVFNTDAVGEYGAFRQKWASGIEVPRDPVTGQPITPYEAGLTKLFVGEGDAKFGDFNATDLSGYISLGQDIAAHIARVSRVPVTYFLSNVANLSADALALLVSGLVKKCERRVKGYEPAFEGAMRLAFKSIGDPRANQMDAEVKWASMETRSVAQDADAAVKLTQGDNPVITPQTAQEKYLGMSQTERDRDDTWRRRQRGAGVLTSLLGQQATPVVPGGLSSTDALGSA